MSREELLECVCFTDYTNECSSCDGRYNCQDCKDAINPLLDAYDKQIKADAIKEVIEVLKGVDSYVADLVEEIFRLKEQKG